MAAACARLLLAFSLSSLLRAAVAAVAAVFVVFAARLLAVGAAASAAAAALTFLASRSRAAFLNSSSVRLLRLGMGTAGRMLFLSYCCVSRFPGRRALGSLPVVTVSMSFSSSSVVLCLMASGFCTKRVE
jgi:hypothetical protein